MKLKLSSSLFILGMLATSGFSEEPENSGPFSLSFSPGVSQEVQALSTTSGNSGTGPWHSLGGFNLGFQSPDSSGDSSWHSHFNVTEFQTLMSAGISSVLWETDSILFSGQALGGYALGHNDFADSWHGSFDLYGATALGPKESNFLKFGAFIDIEEDFGKWGPQAGLLLGAEKKHPVTLDVAYGQGIGDQIAFNNSVWSVAEHDVQARAGVFLNSNLQVGLTGQFLKWDDMSGVEEDWKTGGFVSWYSDDGVVISIGAASGEHGTNGFASLSFTPSNRSNALLTSAKGGKEVFRDIPDFAPRAWMTAPVRRLQTVEVRQVTSHDFAQMQTQNTTMLGGSAVATFFLFGDPLTRIGTNADRLRVVYTNTTNFPQNVTIVSMELFGGGTFDPGVSGVVNAGGTLTAETIPGNNSPAAVHVQTIVFSVNGQTISRDFTFPGTVTNGFSTAPVSVP